MGFLSGVVGKYVFGALGAALLTLGVYHTIVVGALKLDVATKETEIVQLKSDLKNAVAENTKYATLVKLQNDKVEALMAEAADRMKKAEAEIAAAREHEKKWRTAYDNVLKAGPAFPNDVVRSLDKKLKDYVETRRKEGASR